MVKTSFNFVRFTVLKFAKTSVGYIRLLGVVVLWLVGSESKAQLTGKVTDANTGAPVAYANIQIENGNKGTTAAEDGSFSLDIAASANTFLIISSVGYVRQRVEAAAGSLTIALVPQPLLLREVTVRKPSGRGRKTVVGGFKKSKLRSGFGIGGQAVSPWVIARYYPYLPDYEQTPYVQEIQLVVWSSIPNAKFRLRLLGATAAGAPGDDLLATPLTASAPKGMHVVTVRLDEQQVLVPHTGFFIAFEWLIIPSNQAKTPYTASDGIRKMSVSYEPTLAGSAVPSNANTWMYRGGRWSRNTARHKDNTYTEPQYRVVLSD